LTALEFKSTWFNRVMKVLQEIMLQEIVCILLKVLKHIDGKPIEGLHKR